MDTVAHALWAWTGAEVLRRRGRMTKRTLVAGVALAALPDLLQMTPLVAGALLGQVSGAELLTYARAAPGMEPALRGWVSVTAHHLHCLMHSVLVLGVISLVLYGWRRAWFYPTLGWWLHIAMDVPTHSARYYTVPVFYPLSYRGFDGVAWTSPWVIILNYVGLAIAAAWLYRTRELKLLKQPTDTGKQQ